MHGLQVPWSRLGAEPIVVELDKVYLLVHHSETSSHLFSTNVRQSMHVKVAQE